MKKVDITISIERITEKMFAAEGSAALMANLQPEGVRMPTLGEGNRKLLSSLAWLQVPGAIMEFSPWVEDYSMEGELSASGEVNITLRVQTRTANRVKLHAGNILEDIIYLKSMEHLLREPQNAKSTEYSRQAASRSDDLKTLLARVPPGNYRHRPYWY